MANFLTRLVTRHLGLTPVVQPFIAPMFASESVVLGSDSPGFEAQTSSIDSSWEEERSWGGDELGRRRAGESSSGTGKMPIPQAEQSSSGGVGVSPAQAIDSPVNPPNLADFGGFAVEDISLEQPSPVKSTLPLVPPQAIPSVQPTTTNAPNRIEPLVNEVLEIGQQRDNAEVLERDRSNVQPNSQTSNLGQGNTLRETQPTPAVQASPTSEMIQPLRSPESPISPPIQAPQSQASPFPNSVQEVPHTAPSSQPSATPQVQNKGNAANVNSPELPLVPSETVLPIPPSVASKPSRVEPLINNDVAPSVQPTQQLIESDLNQYRINSEKSINRQQNTPTSWSSEQMRGRIEGGMGQSLPDDSSSKPSATVTSRTLSQQPETSTGSNPPLRTPAQRREFFQLVPQRSMSGSQSVPVLGVPDGAKGRRGDGGKESVGSLTATGDERMSEQSFLPQQNVDDPPKSPLKRGTLSSTVPPVNRESVSSTVSPVNRESVSNTVLPVNRENLSNTVPPLNKKTLSNIVPPLNKKTLSNIIPPFLRGARGDRAMPSTFETPPESSSAMQVQVQSEKLSSLTRRSLWVLSQSSSRQSKVYPITQDVPTIPSSNPSHRRNAANFDSTTRLNPVEATPTIQISIGRIEVRANQPQTPPPRTKSTQRGPTQSLQDYLKQRQGGNS